MNFQTHSFSVIAILSSFHFFFVHPGEPYNAMLSDVWSLGVVLYVMLNNALPFDDSNRCRMMKRQMRRKFTFSKSVKLTDAVTRIIKKMLEPDLTLRMHLEAVSREKWLEDAMSEIPESKRNEAANN